MKIGCISWSHRNDFSEGRLDLFSWMEHCKKDCKLDGVEIWNNHVASLEEDYLKRLLQKSRELSLPIYSVATKCVFGDFSEDKVSAAQDTLRAWLAAADILGAPLLRVSVAGDDLRNPARQSRVFSALAQVVGENKYPHIKVGIENQEPGVVQNIADVKAMTTQTDGKLCLVLDNGSFINKADSYAFLQETIGVAGVVHTKFFQLSEDGSDKVLDYARIRDIILASGYQGYLSIEYDSAEPAIRDVPRIAEYLRRLF